MDHDHTGNIALFGGARISHVPEKLRLLAWIRDISSDEVRSVFRHAHLGGTIYRALRKRIVTSQSRQSRADAPGMFSYAAHQFAPANAPST